MKNIGKISATSAVLFLLLFPAFGFVSAQTGSNDYTLLAPLPGISTCKDGSTPEPIVKNADGSTSGGCQTTLSKYLPNAFNLIIGLAAVLAFLVLTYGGVLYMTSDAITGKSQGKEYITNALWGLGLVLASWVILYTINPAILHFQLELKSPVTAAQMQSPDLLSAMTASLAAGTPKAGQIMTQAQIDANKAIAAQIGQTPNPCAQGQTTNCVNLVGLQQNTVTGIQQLKATCASVNGDACPNFVITAGSIDPGDTTHDPNGCHPKGTCVDVGPTPDLNKTIENDTKDFTFVSKNPDGSCARYTDNSGNTYLYETANVSCGGSVASSGNHWHITFK